MVVNPCMPVLALIKFQLKSNPSNWYATFGYWDILNSQMTDSLPDLHTQLNICEIDLFLMLIMGMWDIRAINRNSHTHFPSQKYQKNLRQNNQFCIRIGANWLWMQNRCNLVFYIMVFSSRCLFEFRFNKTNFLYNTHNNQHHIPLLKEKNDVSFVSLMSWLRSILVTVLVYRYHVILDRALTRSDCTNTSIWRFQYQLCDLIIQFISRQFPLEHFCTIAI